MMLKVQFCLGLLLGCLDRTIAMDKDTKVAAEDPKLDLFEDDDEFEEFEINEGNFLFFFVAI